MSNLVIVAIPDENDRVWKVSSEKVPHLTLLYLGDADQVQNLESIVEFVQHAADTSLKRFYLNVDRRDTLGADDADVLFFRTRGYDIRAVKDFRSLLLKDNNIKSAFDSTAQFELPPEVGAAGQPWIPHLTLGYPTAPAKEIPDDQISGFYGMEFTKVAVWTGDYDGPEFVLKDYWDEFDPYESPAVAMSSLSANDVRVANGLEALEHFGVKGMRWGVTKNARTARADAKFEKKATSFKTGVQVYGKAVGHFNSQIDSLNKKYPHDLTKPENAEHKARYDKEVAKLFDDSMKKAANEIKSKSGNKQYDIADHGDHYTVVAKDVQHADGDEAIFDVTRDENGLIVKAELRETAMAQSADLGAEFLAHYGIKGMRWGHRTAKPAPTAVTPSAKSVVPHGTKKKTKVQVEGGENHPAHQDAIKVAEARAKLAKSGTAALSNNELREVANRIQLEQQVKQLTAPGGKKFVSNLLKNQGNQSANRVISRKAMSKGF